MRTENLVKKGTEDSIKINSNSHGGKCLDTISQNLQIERTSRLRGLGSKGCDYLYSLKLYYS